MRLLILLMLAGLLLALFPAERSRSGCLMELALALLGLLILTETAALFVVR